MSVGNNCLIFFKFQNTHSKYLKKKFSWYLSDVQQDCGILLHILLLEILWIQYFRLLVFLLLKEGKAHMQLPNSSPNYASWWLSRMVGAEFKRGSVKLLDNSSDFSGYHADFHEGHGTNGAWQGRSTACVNWRNATWFGHGVGTAWYVWISLKGFPGGGSGGGGGGGGSAGASGAIRGVCGRGDKEVRLFICIDSKE